MRQSTTATRTMLLVTDETGRILAAVPVGGRGDKSMTVGIEALPGQRLHQVEVPEALSRLGGRDLHRLLSQARLAPGAATLTFPKITRRQAPH